MIGAAAGLLGLLTGRVAGISAIVGGLLTSRRGDSAWRVAFIAGLIGSTLIYARIRPLPNITLDAGNGAMVIAGLLVGIGTAYGGGCTSGHGVCGIARLSMRSMAATVAFMAAGFATVYLLRHVRGG